MAVCQFFLKGQCRFGDNCRNEHPANVRQSGFGANTWNRPSGGTNDPKLILPFNATSISNDLTPHVDKPIWPLSSYAPSKHEPLLIAGLDESPEELRVKAVTARASGNINAYLEYEGRQISAADRMFMNARNNSAQFYDQAVKQSELPARLEAVTNAQNTTSAFGNNTNSTPALPSTSSAFPNTNTTTSAFGRPAFGQPAFGQSTFGQPSFGQPIQNLPTSTTSTAPTGAFGQPLNNPAPVSAFGQPLQPPATTSVFGQAATLGQSTTSSFIKPASGAFSAFNNTGSSGAFGGGNNNTTNTTSGFSAFASQPSAFSLAAQNAPNTGSAFGQPSFGQPIPSTSAPTASSVFGNPTPAQTSVFGAPSAFGVLAQQPQVQQPAQQQQQQQAAPASAFEVNTTPSAFNTNTSNPAFGQSSFGNTNNPQSTPAFGNSLSSNTNNNKLDNSTFISTAPSISIDMQSGASSNPSNNNSTFGATTSTRSQTKSVYKPGSTPYDQQIPANYKEALPKSVVQAFESQKFEWGDVPEWVPPVEVR